MLIRLTDLTHRELIWRRSLGKCYYCAKDLPIADMHIDHMLPAKRGGTNDMSNLVAACRSCNIGKGDRTPEEWRAPKPKQHKMPPAVIQIRLDSPWKKRGQVALAKRQQTWQSILEPHVRALILCLEETEAGDKNLEKRLRSIAR